MDDLTGMIATDRIEIEVTIRLGRTRMTVAELSRLTRDDIVTLDQEISDGVEICVGERVIAEGELTTASEDDNRLCVRVLGIANQA